MEVLKSLLLGVVQGVTEWLPISSTAHLLLLDEVLHVGLSAAAKELFLILIQLASILAVVVHFFATLNPFTTKKNSAERQTTWVLLAKIIVATIPAAVVGLFADAYLESHLQKWSVIAFTLAFYGVLYVILEKSQVGKRERRVIALNDITWGDTIALGLFQVLALIPGTSRSGSTILGAIILGFERGIAAQFSFFMAIPVMAGASLLKVLKLGFAFSGAELLIIGTGSAVAFIVSLVVIRAMLAYLKRHDFSIFGYYRIALAIFIVFTLVL